MKSYPYSEKQMTHLSRKVWATKMNQSEILARIETYRHGKVVEEVPYDGHISLFSSLPVELVRKIETMAKTGIFDKV